MAFFQEEARLYLNSLLQHDNFSQHNYKWPHGPLHWGSEHDKDGQLIPHGIQDLSGHLEARLALVGGSFTFCLELMLVVAWPLSTWASY